MSVMLDIAKEFGYKITAFHHAVEAYKIADLLEDAPDPETEQPLSIVDAAIRFVTERAPRAGRNDAYSRRALLRALAQLKGSLEQEQLAQTASSAGQDIWDRLAVLPGQLQVGGMGPRPGCLHAASIWAGGHANRSSLFVVGLDDLRFPGAERQDPLLLDRERQRLSEQLPTAITTLGVGVAS